MRKRYYTLWKAKDIDDEEPMLLENEKYYLTKYFAFKRAHQLAKQLPANWDYVILVRKVTYGSTTCVEWVFPSEK